MELFKAFLALDILIVFDCTNRGKLAERLALRCVRLLKAFLENYIEVRGVALAKV